MCGYGEVRRLSTPSSVTADASKDEQLYTEWAWYWQDDFDCDADEVDDADDGVGDADDGVDDADDCSWKMFDPLVSMTW